MLRRKQPRKPNVLILTNKPAPYRKPLFEMLSRHLNLTVFFCQRSQRWPDFVGSDTVHYVQLPSRTFRVLGRGPEWVFNPGLRKRLRDMPFDICIAGENFTTAPSVLSVLMAARRENKPFVLWSGAIDTPYASGHWASNTYRWWLYSRTDAFVAYGESAKRFLVNRGIPPWDIYTGTQGIVPGWVWQVDADKKALGLGDRTVVLYVGDLIARKGVADLIRAYQRARQADSLLVIVGDGPQRRELVALVGTDQDILFAGHIEGEEKMRYYASADVFVLPTLHDPWPQVINEAMFFGLPIITTDRDGCAHEVVRSCVNGFVVRAGDLGMLTADLQRLLTNPLLRQKMGQQSKLIIAKYTLERACKAFLRAGRHAAKAH